MDRKVYMIADTHFGDERILHYQNRPFDSVEDMDQKLIEYWNETVKPEDQIFVLGDFSLYGEDKTADIISQLNGKKFLILGNHDRHISPSTWRNLGFQEAFAWPILYDDWYILSHEPIYINTNMPYANIFGHVHGSPMYCDESVQSFCVCVERTNYHPIEWGRIKYRKRTGKSYIKENDRQ